MPRQYYVYILTNQRNTTIYTGITGDLIRRIYEHKNKLVDGFSKRYNLDKLVYLETTESAESAIAREKQIKNYSRAKKDALINKSNPQWWDLYDQLV